MDQASASGDKRPAILVSGASARIGRATRVRLLIARLPEALRDRVVAAAIR
jgi:hypothetical protein